MLGRQDVHLGRSIVAPCALFCSGTEHPEQWGARQAYVVYIRTHRTAIRAFHGQLMNTLDTFKVITCYRIPYYFDYVLNSDIPFGPSLPLAPTYPTTQ
jgi:hypothetical protein